jgi:outer membrane protein assembly factor BamB
MRFAHLLAFIPILTTAALVQAGNWNTWRGSNADGVSDEKNPPVSWSATENVTWKSPLPGGGNSTPVVWDDKVFVTCASKGGTVRSILCFDRATGKELWHGDTAYEAKEPTHPDNPYCSSSPIDGSAVYAWLGSAGVVAYDVSGKLLWKHDLGKFDQIWGNAGSPVFYNDTIILNCGPGTRCFLVALKKQTGDEAWKQELPEAQGKPDEFKGSWSTPMLTQIGEARQLVVDLPGYIGGFDPETGKEIWRCNGLGPLSYADPLIGKQVIVAMSGYGGPAMGMRKPKAADHGDLTKSHQLWRITTKIQQRIGSGVLTGDRVYLLNQPGVAQCFNANTGKELWHERATGSSWSSTTLVDGKLYSTTQDGTSVIWKPGDKFESIAENKIDEHMNASLIFSDGQIFVRTYKALYCIGKRKA